MGHLKKFVVIPVAVAIVGALAWYALSPIWDTSALDEASPVAALPSAAVLARGDFKPAAHGVRGRALLIREGDRQTVRLENFETINGPDVRIYLARDERAADYIDLGPLRATSGNVNYPVPEGADTAGYGKVLVWCEDFSVLFSYADLKAE